MSSSDLKQLVFFKGIRCGIFNVCLKKATPALTKFKQSSIIPGLGIESTLSESEECLEELKIFINQLDDPDMEEEACKRFEDCLNCVIELPWEKQVDEWLLLAANLKKNNKCLTLGPKAVCSEEVLRGCMKKVQNLSFCFKQFYRFVKQLKSIKQSMMKDRSAWRDSTHSEL
ncbi:MAG: hypothetical protein MHMPM18_002808 [Marteilia pararefringens]